MNFNQKFENILNYDLFLNVVECGYKIEEFADYIADCIEAKEDYFFCEEEIDKSPKINQEFLAYAKEAYALDGRKFLLIKGEIGQGN